MFSNLSTKLNALSLTAILLSTLPLTARAELFGTCTADPNLIVLTNAMLTLSSDIGIMADRILITEDKIGEMADRIVETETLMVTALEQLNQNGGLAAVKPGVLLTSPLTGDVVLRNTAPVMQLSDSATSYVLYISPTASFSGNQVIPLLVSPQMPLSVSWTQAIQSITGDAAYIAVRSVVGESSLSEISNAVRITLQ